MDWGWIWLCVIGVSVIVWVWLYTTPTKAPSPFPKHIFQTWKSKTDIPENMDYWSSTWKLHNPHYTYTLWDDADNLAFVKKEFPWFLPTYEGYDREIKRADAIRYMFLYRFGGIYADMDFECLKPFDELLEKFEGYDIILGSMESDGNPWNISNSIPNAIMISKPGCEFWIRLLELLVKKSKGTYRVEEATGPIVLKECYGSWFWWRKDSVLLAKPETFYPISWITDKDARMKSLQTDDRTHLTQTMKTTYPASYAVTYWTHSW